MNKKSLPAAALALGLSTALAFLPAAPAWAHDELVDSTPAEGETLTALPDAFSVTTNETLLDLQSDGSGGQGAFGLVVRDADGGYYGDGCVSVVDATMSTDPVLGDSGDYTMIWQVVSADGHPVSGEIAFTWEAPDGFEPVAAQAAAPVCGGEPEAGPPSSADAGSEVSPWIFPITVVLGLLVLLLALRSARLQMRNRAASRDDDSTNPPV